MLDFSEIPKDGNGLELLARELLFHLNYHVQWSGRGPDGGKDLIFRENLESRFSNISRTWLVQCKHNAHSGSSVGVAELGEIVDACAAHQAQGYLLICTTHPSSAVVNRLEGLTTAPGPLVATYWDSTILERLLTQPNTWGIAQKFFPKSAEAEKWKIFATERPNHWIGISGDIYTHICNRIGSHNFASVGNIKKRLKEIEKIGLPKGHYVAMRAIYFDDKNGNFTWFLDYMRPKDEKPFITHEGLLSFLGDGNPWDDGHAYYFDVVAREYFPHSDHYDPNHYSYYTPHLSNFMIGLERKENGNF